VGFPDLADSRDDGQLEAAFAMLYSQLNSELPGRRDGAVIVDASGLIVCCNTALLRLLGLPEEQDIRGKLLADLLRSCAGDQTTLVPAAENADLHEYSIPVFELRVRGAVERLLLVRSAPFLLETGCPFYFLWAFTDITNERRLRDHYAHSEKIRINAQLAGGVAHEINNALTSVLGNIELTRLLCTASQPNADDSHPIQKHLLAAEDGARRIHRLVKDLIEFGSRPQIVLRPGSLIPLLNRVITSLQKGALVHVRLQLDSGTQLWTTHYDEAALFHALLSLGNSICRDLGASGGTVDISVTNHKESSDSTEWVRISVVDRTDRELNQHSANGYHSAAAIDIYGGTLALSVAMVNAVIHEMKGRLHVISRPPDGREICMLLPRLETHSRSAQGRQGRSLRILVIDDDQTILSVCRNMLELFGHRVSAALSGLDGLILLEASTNFDVILLDESMPGLSGHETLTEMRKRKIDIPVIVIAGRPVDRQFDSRTELNTEPAGFLQKPFRLQDLKEILEPWTSQ
jgi:CheY-like chemotaxis protein/signal transduction histidine kinase